MIFALKELFDEMVKEETEHYNDRRIELSSLVEMSNELRHVSITICFFPQLVLSDLIILQMLVYDGTYLSDLT